MNYYPTCARDSKMNDTIIPADPTIVNPIPRFGRIEIKFKNNA